jgi:hypothetical protein
MSARIYRPEFDQSRHDSAQIGGDYYREYAERYLIPQIVERQKQALNVAPEFFQFYQRSYTGKRCSCWAGIETTPAASCLVCFGTGNTSGYQLYGHHTHVFSATSEASTIGAVIDYDEITRPLHFRLMHKALKGFIDFTLPVNGGTNQCSLASLHAVTPRGTRVRAACKLFSESSFTPLSMPAISARLQQAQLQGGLHIRIVLERDSVATKSPRFSHLRIRYQTLADDRVAGDIPRSSEANRSSEFGMFEDVATKTIYLGPTLRSVTTEDLLRHVQTGRLWKIFSVNPNAPAGILTSWDVEATLVQNMQRYANLP